MKHLQKAVIAVLVYHDIFDYPLTEQEIFRFLVQIPNPKSQIPNKSKYSKFQIQNSLKTLQKKEKVIKQDNYYCLVGRKKIIALRKKREKHSQKKIKIAKNTVRIFKLIPWIKMIGITGALAMHNSDENDDIDFLVITAKNRLWLTRLLIVIILEALGSRRRPSDKKFKDKICLNMFLDEKTLSLSNGKQNLFTAHEIVQMEMIFNRNKTYERFLQVNDWVKDYLPNAAVYTPEVVLRLRRTSGVNIFNFLEKITYQFQLKYMKSKRTREQISPHFAFFHPKDGAKKILKRYDESIHHA